MRFSTSALSVMLLSAVLPVAAKTLPSEGDPIPREVSTDATYGYSESNPIRVGRKHADDEDRFLASLRGPDGQRIKYRRLGSCCSFKTPNAWVGDEGLLDKYEVTYKGLTEPIVLYLDMYDYEQPKAPVGFTVKGAP